MSTKGCYSGMKAVANFKIVDMTFNIYIYKCNFNKITIFISSTRAIVSFYRETLQLKMVERVSRNENCSLTPVSSQKCSGSKYFMQEFCCGRLLLEGVLWGFTREKS